MSYTPTILVAFEDLKALEKKNPRIFDKWNYDEDDEEGRAMLVIIEAYEGGADCTIKGVDLVEVFPADLTSHNSDVRNMLTELEVEYGTIN